MPGDERTADPDLYPLSGQIPACSGRSIAKAAEFAGSCDDQETSGSCVLLQVALSYMQRECSCACARACRGCRSRRTHVRRR